MTECECGRCARPRSRWLAPAVMVAVAAVLSSPGLAGCGHALRAGTRPGLQAGAADPPLAAIAESAAGGSSSRVELVSPTTGRVVKVLARVGTSNGFALSANSKNLYVTSAVRGAMKISRISVATGKASFVADGVYPAISPGGRYLAYATGPRFTSLAVRDLRTGRVRVAGLASLLGSNASLLNQGGGISWLGDGDELVVVPGITPSEASAVVTGRSRAGQARSALAPPGRKSIIVVKLRPDGLAARRIIVPDPYQEPNLVISGDLSQPRAFLIAWTGFAVAGTITRVSLRGGGYRARVIARLPRGVMPVVIAPRGDRVLYLAGQPPVLWTAAISNGRLSGQHRLLAGTGGFGVDQAAW